MSKIMIVREAIAKANAAQEKLYEYALKVVEDQIVYASSSGQFTVTCYVGKLKHANSIRIQKHLQELGYKCSFSTDTSENVCLNIFWREE